MAAATSHPGPSESSRRAEVLVPLEDAGERPLDEVGGKARTLGRLLAAGFPVPPGFVLTASTVEGMAESPGAEEVLTEVSKALAPAAIAVRSSGAGEDGSRSSYAGQYETVLGVQGPEELREAVRRCRTAAFADHVRAYRESRRESRRESNDAAPDVPEPRLALILQRMIPADAAGVAFTVDPRTGARDSVVVEATAGLGETLVSGEVTPECWRVLDDGVRRDSGPGRVLDPETVEAIGVLARRVEATLGEPQDIEWVVADGTLHLLQARPVTTGVEGPPPVPVPADPPETGFWFRDEAHFPRPFHPLFGSLYIPSYEEAVGNAFREFGVLVDGIELREVGGWPYTRIVPPAGKEGPAPPAWLLWLLARVTPSLRTRMRRAREAVSEGRDEAYVRRWWAEWRPELDGWVRRTDDVELGSLSRAELARHYASAAEAFDRVLRIHFKLFPPFFLAVTDLVFFCRDELGWDKGRATELLAGVSETSSEPGRALEELARQAEADPAALPVLEDPGPEPLERLRRAAPDFAEAFGRYQERYGLRVLHYDFATPTFRERPAMVLGFVRNQVEKDRGDGSVGGGDGRVIGGDGSVGSGDGRVIGGDGSGGGDGRGVGGDGGEGDAREGRPTAETVTELREERIREARGALRQRPEARRRFDTLLERAHQAYPVREDNEFVALCVLGLLRYAALEVGRRMAGAGHLERADRVFFLRTQEVEEWLESPRDPGELARRREGQHRWALANPGPPSYGEDPGPPPDPSPLPPVGRRVTRALLWMVENDIDTPVPDTGRLDGVGASAGRYTGPARIVRNEEEFGKVQAGDVLVCPVTSPTWSVLFSSIGGLVTDAGGLLSHPAIIAREFGIPAVLATGRATEELTDGQLVTVDGTAGRVEPR